MYEKRYTRLKLKMLLLVVIGALVSCALALFLLEVVVDGVLQDPIPRLFVWVATHLFGQSTETAEQAYGQYIRANKVEFIILALVVLMILAFYVAIGRFTTWLEEIRWATHSLTDTAVEEIRLPKELQPLEQDLNVIRRQLLAKEALAKENERRQRDLTAFLAHDLKTPLTSVVGYLTLLHDEPNLTEEQRAKFTGVALDKARRLEELLGEFFDITRMDLDRIPAGMVPIQLTVLLEQLSDEFYPIFAERDLTCETRLEPHLVVQGDPDKLARVFDNVLRNAYHYSTAGGVVHVSAQREGDRAEVVISNEGLEIPEGELAHIFEKFYRLDTARSSRTGGAGLGLAIAKEIVERHGGTIRAESNGRFTSFVISLPLCPDQPPEQP